MIYFAIATKLLIIIFMSFGVDKLWTRHINSRVLSFFLFPGSVAHVLSHAILCLITGATIRNLNIFRFPDNEIQFEKPKISVAGNFLISIAPIFGCGMAILFLAAFLGSSAGSIKGVPSENIGIYHSMLNLGNHVQSTLLAFWYDIGSYKAQSLIFILTSVIFTISMSPKREEFKYLIPGLAVTAGIPFFIEMAGISLNSNSLWTTLMDNLWQLTTLSISVLSALLAITLFVIGIITGFQLTFARQSGNTQEKRRGKVGADIPRDL